MPYLLPQVSPPHKPPFLSPLSFLPFPLVKVSFCFRVQLQGNKISPSKNFLILSLKINFFFYCMTTAFLVHTSFMLSCCFLSIMPHISIILPKAHLPLESELLERKNYISCSVLHRVVKQELLMNCWILIICCIKLSISEKLTEISSNCFACNIFYWIPLENELIHFANLLYHWIPKNALWGFRGLYFLSTKWF